MMGKWGDKIFENDLSCDVKEIFLTRLQEFSYDCEKATQKIISEYQAEIDDENEAIVFWLALADLQWKKGMLLTFVKEKAIEYINHNFDSLTNKNQKQDLEKLKIRLLSKQPPKTIPKKKQNFICEWKIGDTFAYKINGDFAKEKGFLGRYLIFHKVSEIKGYPNEIYPVVVVKITQSNHLPSTLDEIDGLEYVQISVLTEFTRIKGDNSNPVDIQREIAKTSKINSERDECGYIPSYRIAISFTSKRNVPKDLIYLGNYQLLPPKINYTEQEIQEIMWKYTEKIIIDRYIAFNLKESPLYNTKK